MIFKNRKNAGKKLAKKLKKFKNAKDTIIVALPRGGVIIAYEIAKELNLPLDLVVPRKIGAPGNEEFAIGAITQTGEAILDEQIISLYNIPQEYIDKTIQKEKEEAKRRIKTYRAGKKSLNFKNKTIILVDDGIATGMTLKAAIKSIKKSLPTKIIIAVPTAPKDSINEMKKLVDEVICLDIPIFFGAIGAFYKNFSQTTDKEVIEIMNKKQ